MRTLIRGAGVVLGSLAVLTVSGMAATTPREACQQTLTAAYSRSVSGALRAKRDVWGEALLARAEGPTYEAARRYLKPLLLARAARRTSLTESGVHYVPFAQPAGDAGAGSVALHVADGSQILSHRADGTSLTIGVGNRGGERYGSCLSRLAPPRLADGYLPILETGYVDAVGVRYRQESFAARIQQTRSLVSFVRLEVDARAAAADVLVRLAPSASGLRVSGDRLLRGDATYLMFSRGAALDGFSPTYAIQRGAVRTLYAAWLASPLPTEPLTVDAETYGAARRSVVTYWKRRLAEGGTIEVPERRVLDAERSLLIQNLALTWRYSVGNPYEQFSFPEGVDVAQVMAAWGFSGVARAILETSLTRRPTPYGNWKMGQKLVGSALHYRLFHDRSYVDEVTPVLRGYVAALGRQIAASPRGILARERYSSDIPDLVYGLHSQAVVWQGLRAMSRVWAQTGRAALSTQSRRLAARLGVGLRRAVRESQRTLPDGSLFVPVRLLDPEPPYDTLTASRSGSYWNLVMPYALGSGLLPPESREARGILRYLLGHGSRLLGLVRAGAYALYGRQPLRPASGTDQVYGLNVSRFLADNDEPDQLVLSLYGHLAAGMTPGTFVSGEAASVAPISGAYHRSMYLPPNGASNGSFLETLRLMLVHETFDRQGRPHGLELAYATPRAWLRTGQRIVVRRVPTSFGPVSFSIETTDHSVHVSLDVPQRAALRALRLRLRLPRGRQIARVFVDGRGLDRFDRRTGTIELPPRPGRLMVIAPLAGA